MLINSKHKLTTILYNNNFKILGIESGNVEIKRSENLCYMNPNKNFFDYSQVL